MFEARIETTKLVGRELAIIALIAFCLLCMGLNVHAASKSFDVATFVHVPVNETALHDAVWSDTNLCAPGSPRPVSGSGVGGEGLTQWRSPSIRSDDWWRTGGTPPNLQPSSEFDWLDQHLDLLIDEPATTMTLPIEQIQLGQRVIGENPEPSDVDPDFTDPVQEATRRIVATVYKEDGTAVDVEMLRHASLVQALGLIPGAQLPLHLAELDVQGIATVTEITECAPIQQGEGQVVTARFVTRHAENRVRVTLSDGTEIIATDVHPVWTPGNRQWTPAGELIAGTAVDTFTGELTVRSVEPLRTAAPVYNVEVNGHHVYRVTDIGVLVHNTYSYTLEGATYRNTSADEARGFYRTEPRESLGDMGEIHQRLDDNDLALYADPIIVTNQGGITYVIDGHHRLTALVEGNHTNIVPITVIPSSSVTGSIPDFGTFGG